MRYPILLPVNVVYKNRQIVHTNLPLLVIDGSVLKVLINCLCFPQAGGRLPPHPQRLRSEKRPWSAGSMQPLRAQAAGNRDFGHDGPEPHRDRGRDPVQRGDHGGHLYVCTSSLRVLVL